MWGSWRLERLVCKWSCKYSLGGRGTLRWTKDFAKFIQSERDSQGRRLQKKSTYQSSQAHCVSFLFNIRHQNKLWWWWHPTRYALHIKNCCRKKLLLTCIHSHHQIHIKTSFSSSTSSQQAKICCYNFLSGDGVILSKNDLNYILASSLVWRHKY